MVIYSDNIILNPEYDDIKTNNLSIISTKIFDN